jgi:hypothetical protein
MQGAVLYGVADSAFQRPSKAKACPYSYAIHQDEVCVDMLQSQKENFEAMRVGINEPQIFWVLDKGDLIVSKQTFKIERELYIKLPELWARGGSVRIVLWRSTEGKENRQACDTPSGKKTTYAKMIYID